MKSGDYYTFYCLSWNAYKIITVSMPLFCTILDFWNYKIRAWLYEFRIWRRNFRIKFKIQDVCHSRPVTKFSKITFVRWFLSKMSDIWSNSWKMPLSCIQSSLSSRTILKIKLSWPPKKLKIVLLEIFYIKSTVSLLKFTNCPVRPTFGRIVLLDRRPTRQIRLYYSFYV